jgi:hypothetical protein
MVFVDDEIVVVDVVVVVRVVVETVVVEAVVAEAVVTRMLRRAVDDVMPCAKQTRCQLCKRRRVCCQLGRWSEVAP